MPSESGDTTKTRSPYHFMLHTEEFLGQKYSTATGRRLPLKPRENVDRRVDVSKFNKRNLFCKQDKESFEQAVNELFDSHNGNKHGHYDKINSSSKLVRELCQLITKRHKRYEKLGRELKVQLIAESALAYHNNVCPGGHTLLFIAARLCHKFSCRRSSVLTRLLVAIHTCPLWEATESGLNIFFQFLERNRTCKPNPIFDNMKNSSFDKNLEILEYFLKHSLRFHAENVVNCLTNESPSGKNNYCGKLTKFDFANACVPCKEASRPLLLAAHAENAPAILLLVRYGANPLQPPCPVHVGEHEYYQHALHLMLSKLNACVFLRLHQEKLPNNPEESFAQQNDRRESNLVECVSVLCRALSSLPAMVVSDHVDTTSSYQTDRQLSRVYAHRFPEGYICGAPSLTHLCRMRVRQALLAQDLLPVGIERLPLPKYLKDFLDLKVD